MRKNYFLEYVEAKVETLCTKIVVINDTVLSYKYICDFVIHFESVKENGRQAIIS